MNDNKVKRKSLTGRRPTYFQKRRRQHDPWLALNMSIFNFEGGWSRIINPVRVRENN